jgi:hypothetical protein
LGLNKVQATVKNEDTTPRDRPPPLKNETIYTRDCGFAVKADYRILDDHYNVKISDDYFISADYTGDFDEDRDVDGTDLADFAIQFSAGDEEISLLQAFASEFGHID